jgi:hypothetical protein
MTKKERERDPNYLLKDREERNLRLLHNNFILTS